MTNAEKVRVWNEEVNGSDATDRKRFRHGPPGRRSSVVAAPPRATADVLADREITVMENTGKSRTVGMFEGMKEGARLELADTT
ncbi:hypothetical protein [Streptomyces sp. NPDC005799]|uniref:hypothetical protein n=1 Tax=Streptomyces sp. NPDC005799 TaxID=3154678 RepID=UPI0033F7CBE8